MVDLDTLVIIESSVIITCFRRIRAYYNFKYEVVAADLPDICILESSMNIEINTTKALHIILTDVLHKTLLTY